MNKMFKRRFITTSVWQQTRQTKIAKCWSLHISQLLFHEWRLFLQLDYTPVLYPLVSYLRQVCHTIMKILLCILKDYSWRWIQWLYITQSMQTSHEILPQKLVHHQSSLELSYWRIALSPRIYLHLPSNKRVLPTDSVFHEAWANTIRICIKHKQQMIGYRIWVYKDESEMLQLFLSITVWFCWCNCYVIR